MPNDLAADCLLPIQLDDPVHRPNAVIHHRLSLPERMSREQFESQMMETVMGEVRSGRESSRTIIE